MKKLISCFILCAMLLTVIPFSVSANTTVVEIGTPDEMAAFGEALAAGDYATGDNTVKLTDNIDMDGKTWAGKGTFSGTFDGQGYTISNLSVISGTAEFGLFGTATGTIKNFNIVDSTFDGAVNQVGAVVGKTAGELTISNINVVNAEFDVTSWVGGILGEAAHTTTVSRCYADATISSDATSGGIVGGWRPGSANSTLTIENCVAEGSITNNKAYSGGILGYSKPTVVSTVNITDCVVNNYTLFKTDSNTSTNGTGGLIGHLELNDNANCRLTMNIFRCSLVNLTMTVAEGSGSSSAYAGLLLGRINNNNANKGGLALTVNDVLLSGARMAGQNASAAAIGYINSHKDTSNEACSVDITVNNVIVNCKSGTTPGKSFAYYARSNSYDSLTVTDMQTNIDSVAVIFDSGYQNFTPQTSVSNVTSYDVSAWQKWTPASAFEDNLPRPTAVCADYVGYQVRDNDVRLVFGIRDVNVAALAELGAKITHGEQTATATVPAVYTQIKAGTNVCTAESVGYDYFYVIEFTDMFDGETTSYDFKFEATYKIGTKSYVNTTTDEVTVEKKQ